MKKTSFALLSFACAMFAASAVAGVEIPFTLPDDGQTYLVTLAITEKANPDRIVSTFVCGQPFATAPGQGSFTAVWDGLDENFMPVPAGDYGVKGIYAPAAEDPIDHEFHAIRARYHSGVGAFLPTPDTPEIWKIPIPFHGDPVNSPLADVDATPSGRMVTYYQYLENGKNCPILDLTRPYGNAQFVRAFPSGGAGGGPCATTDGETVWACTTDGAPFFLYRADAKPFGTDNARHRRGGFLPQGIVTDMACWRGADAAHPFVYAIQRGKLENEPIPGDPRNRTRIVESRTEFIDEITVFNGDNGDVLAHVPVSRPRAMAILGDTMYLLYRPDNACEAIGALPIADGIPQGGVRELFRLPEALSPNDIAVDSRTRFYVSDPKANHVYQFSPEGQSLRVFGAKDVQESGTFDPSTFMTPTRIACWTDAGGLDRLLVVEASGPNRVTEWNGGTGALLAEYPSFQTKANSGYAMDPDHPDHIYLPVHQNWLARYIVDYEKGEWKLDAVFPDVVAGQRRGLDKPVALRVNGRLYLASAQSGLVFRLTDDGRRVVRSAAILREEGNRNFAWNDANGNGEIDDDEKRPIELPGWVFTYHGQNWTEGLVYLAMGQGSRDVWSLSPDSFDEHGNPVFTGFRHVVRDPFFEARATGNPGALEGGNELAEAFSSDWMQADGALGGPIFTQARGGRNYSANYGAQHKVTRYDPDAEGRYSMTWRVGRTNIAGGARRGELVGGMRIFRPRNGILAVIDQSRSGVFLYTDDGLYVDTLFAPGSTREELGVYRQPGEFFAGTVYDNPDNGKIYYASGKYTPFLYEIENWSLTENPVRRLEGLPETVAIDAAQIADPPEMAIALRGGPGRARFAEIGTAFGGVELQGGAMAGWESAQPVAFQGDKSQTVEVRCLYDPDTLHVRWHIRTGSEFQPNPPLADYARIYSHDAATDIASLYLGANGGEARVVFGLWGDDAGGMAPRAIVFHPEWTGADANPVGFRTPVNETRFEHVAEIPASALGFAVDADRKGFVIAASLPRAAFPFLSEPFSGDSRLRLNFDANLGGHNRFWWSNTDGSANTETYDEPTEARLYPGSWSPARFVSAEDGLLVREWVRAGPFGGPGSEGFSWDPRNKDEVGAFFEKAVFPPDEATRVDVAETFDGPLTGGWWGGPATDKRPLRWQAVSLDEMDTRFRLGDAGSQVWFGATWIRADEEVEVELELFAHNMTTLRWRLNGEPIPIGGLKDYAPDNRRTHRHHATRTVTLRAGWNEIWVRGYCVGYAPFRAGIIVHAPESVLWTLRSTNVQP
ncbi:MAG: hypothetical protein ACOX5G_10120 [Kiritimatiellia bacterium]|jgi:hypothetical protein